MRRDVRRKNQEDLSVKIIKYSAIGVAILAVIVAALLIYSKNLNEDVKKGALTSEQISSIFNSTNSVENTESASLEIGKTVEEAENEVVENTIKENTTTEKSTTTNKQNVLTTNKITQPSTKSTATNVNETKKEEMVVELNFVRPVEGEIVKDFAVDNLLYSNTLQEWTIHTGIDIKADKTTVVKAAEAGTVKSIKNDPRYGLTVVIEHANGFQTIYSNLLTSEFVVEGEKVEKGQSLGTVGNTAAFEIADESHLHFEILKDSVQVNPNIYLK